MVKTLKVIVEPGVGTFDELGQRRAGEIAVLIVDRLDPCTIDGRQLPAKQVQLTAEQHELAQDRAESVAIIAPEIGNGFEVGFQMPQQPDHFDVPVGLGFETTP